MIGALRRKAAQVLVDPSLRRYLLGRAFGRIAAPPAFTAGHPPYLDHLDLGDAAPSPAYPRLAAAAAPSAPLTLALPGAELRLERAAGAFGHRFADLETLLGLHRFCWLPVLGDTADPAWVDALWREWLDRFARPDDGWAWHPYTAAERAINILEFGRRHGLPDAEGRTAASLADHARVIARRLEYGGEHYTGNHLSNNGRGLYLIGLELGWERAADLGRRILLAEAARIFAPSGILREGSSHYHLLVTRNYLSCWLAARRHRRPEAAELEPICRKAVAVLAHFDLPGGLPLVGDVSPDCPPDFLSGLIRGGAEGWLATLGPGEREAIAALRGEPAEAQALARDGWATARHGEWAAVMSAPPQGWPFMPGHGHHDLGGIEVHWRGLPLFIDPGRGAYGETGEAALYRSAAVHSTLQVDGCDPTPANRPYYDDSFRRREGGEPPVLAAGMAGLTLVHHGFRRQGVSRVERRLDLEHPGVADTVEGRGRHLITRRLVTPWPVVADGVTAVRVETPAGAVRVHGDAVPVLAPLRRWTAYGRAAPATAIEFRVEANLPWSGTLTFAVDDPGAPPTGG